MAQADEEGEYDVLYGGEDRIRCVKIGAGVGIDRLVDQRAQRPERFVGQRGQREQIVLLRKVLCPADERADGRAQYILALDRDEEQQERRNPRGNRRGDGRALYTHLQGVDEQRVEHGVHDDRNHADVQRQFDLFGGTQQRAEEVVETDGHIAEAGAAQINLAQRGDVRVARKDGQHDVRRKERHQREQERYAQRAYRRQTKALADAVNIAHAPILGDEHARARVEAEHDQIEQPRPLAGHADGRQRRIAQHADHDGIQQRERADEDVLNRNGHGQSQRIAPEVPVAQVF